MDSVKGRQILFLGAALAAIGALGVTGTSCWSATPCCASDEDCAEDFACLGGVCRARCRWPGQCPVGQRCNVELGVCAGGAEPSQCALLVPDAGLTDSGARDLVAEDGGVDAGALDRARADTGPIDLPFPDLSPPDWALPDLDGVDAEPLDKPPTEAGEGDVEEIDAGLCADDIFEENDRREHATLLTDVPISGVACPGDSDFYVADRDRDAVANARLECEHAPGIVFMVLRMPGDARMARSCDPAVGFTEASLSVADPGPAYVEIFTQLGEPAPYTLRFWIEGVTHPCGADPFEDNDAISEAYALQPGSGINASICAGDIDTYAITAYTGEIVRATQEVQEPCSGDRLVLFSTDGSTQLDTVVTSTARTRNLYAEALNTGQHYVQIQSGCATAQLYQLNVATGACTDDAYEENDTRAGAAEVSVGHIDGEVCWRDDDFYRFAAAAGLPLRLDLRFRHAIGDLDLALFNPAGVRVGLSQGVEDYEIIEYASTTSGQYTARVYGFSGAVGPYELELCADDVLEENDALDTAPVVAPGMIEARLCPHDVDHFALALVEGATLEANLVADPTSTQLELSLVDASTGAVVAEATLLQGALLLNYQADASGRYALRVRGLGGAGAPYLLSLATVEP